MANFWKLVNTVIKDSDILLMVMDSRFPNETRNRELEKKILKENKRIIFVLNKCDLVTKDYIESFKKKIDNSVFVSCTKHFGSTKLLKKILEFSRGGKPIVGVIGYPNVGKSSFINLLKGKKSASVSSVSGHTKGIQFIIAKGKIKLIDTPGVLSYTDDDMLKKILIGSVNPHQLKDPEIYAQEMINNYPELISKCYNVIIKKDDFEALDKIAIEKNIIKKGGEPDLKRISVQILYDWQRGKIHTNKLEDENKKYPDKDK